MKLLQRTVRSYLIYSLLLMLVAIPAFYFITQALCLQDVDDALQDRKKQLESLLKTHQEILDKLPWHNINGEILISPPVKLSAFTSIPAPEYTTVNETAEPFRELHTYLTVNHTTYPVILRISLIGIEDLIQGIVITVGLIMALILAGLLWINRQQSKRLWQPFYQALEQLEQFRLNKKPALRFAQTNIREFEDLHRAITQITDRTYQTYLQQKEFTENAAHELQTPLATLQAKLELFMQEETLSSQQVGLLQALSEAVHRMIKLNKGLLLLAKIENTQFWETTPIRLSLVIKRLLDPLKNSIALKGLTLKEHYEASDIIANPILVDILVANLLNNAILYAPSRGNITISVCSNALEITNSGDPLPFGEEKLFLRFQKGSHREAAQGNGLGLAIVKQICDTCHYTLSYQYADGHHFKINFSG